MGDLGDPIQADLDSCNAGQMLSCKMCHKLVMTSSFVIGNNTCHVIHYFMTYQLSPSSVAPHLAPRLLNESDCLINKYCHVPAAVLASCQALLKVLYQGRDREGVRLGMICNPSALGKGLLLLSLLLMLQVLICTLCKDTYHLTMNL